MWINELKNLLGEKIITECIIDSQTIKIHNKGEEVGCNEHKKTNGRKRHIITDYAMDHILKVKVNKANIHDRKGGVKVIGDAFWKDLGEDLFNQKFRKN